MTDTLSADDVAEKTVKRDSDGELIPEEHEIQWGDETKVVKTVPITTGVVNELSHIDDEITALEPEAVHEAFQTIYVEPDPETFTVGDIQDLELPYLKALMQPIDEKIDETIGDESGNPMDMSRQDRAEQMR